MWVGGDSSDIAASFKSHLPQNQDISHKSTREGNLDMLTSACGSVVLA